MWDGKKRFRLGRTLAAAHREWAKRLELQEDARTIGQLLDHYAFQHIPTLRPKTQASYLAAIQRLKPVSLPSRCKKGSVKVVQAFLRIKLLTGRRRAEILRVHCTARKTRMLTPWLCSAPHLTWFLAAAFIIVNASSPVLAQKSSAQTYTAWRSRLDIQGEWTDLGRDAGERFAVKFTYRRRLSARRRLSVEVPLVHTDLKGEPTETGLGDTRFKYFWLDFEKPVEGKVYQGFVPIFDALLPTGDEGRGLGGGAVVLRPGVVVRFKPSDRWSINPLFRYVVSLDDYFVGGNPEEPIPPPDEPPGPPVSRGLFDFFFPVVDVRGFNIDTSFVYRPKNNRHLSFVVPKLEIFWSHSSDNSGTTVTFKLELGKRLNQQFGISGEVELPVSGDTTFDSVLKVTGRLFF